MEIIIGMIKIMALHNANTCTLCENQDYFECFNCLPFSLRNHFSKKLFSGMRSEHQTVWILIILVGLIWVQNVCKAEDIITELNVTISINAINYYLLRGSEPDCLFL